MRLWGHLPFKRDCRECETVSPWEGVTLPPHRCMEPSTLSVVSRWPLAGGRHLSGRGWGRRLRHRADFQADVSHLLGIILFYLFASVFIGFVVL